MEKLISFFKKPYSPYLLLGLIIVGVYYKFFFFGKIPFPGDLLIGSYFPWLDYFKMPVQNPLISDVFSQFFLWKYLAIDSFKNLQWPLWNPYSFTGTPLLATYHSATLYPLNILLFITKYWGWGLFIFSQTLLAAINMYLLLSRWIDSRLARLTGSIIFALGGLMTTWLELGTAVHAIAWLPLSLYFIECYGTYFKARYLLLLIGSQSMLILAGHAQISTYSIIILFIFTLIRSLDNLKRFTVYFFPVIASLTLSLLLCSLQLLPSLDLLNKSIRLTEGYIGEFNFGLLPIKDILKFFVADFFGSPITRNYWGFLNFSETSGFIGSLTLPLLLFSFIYLRKNKVISFLLVLLATTLILSFDNYISQTIYQLKIPFLTSSYATRILFITTFSVASLSAFAVDQFIKDQFGEKKLFRLTIFSWAAFVGIALGSILVYQNVQGIIKSVSGKTHLKPLLDFYLNDKDYALSNFQVATRNSILPILILSAFLVYFILIGNLRIKFIRKYSKTLIVCGLFALITFDLGRYFLKFNPFVSQDLIFPATPAIEFLKNQKEPFRLGREHAEVLPPNTWTAYNLQSLEGYDPLYLNRYGKFMHYLNGGDIRTGNSTRYAELSFKYDSPFIDAANVKYFIGIGRDKNGYTPGDLINYHFNEAGYNRVFNDKSAVILENPKALPRVYFASSFKVVDESSLENIIMTDASFDPRTTALLEKDLKIVTTSGKGQASITSYSPNTVKVETKTENPEILILADQFDEGWKAKIDGEQTLVSPANYIFRAVKVPAGKHEVIFSYYPKSFDIGLKISLATLVLLTLLSIFAKAKKIL